MLRLLQEREFERVGGTKTYHMDARIIACTHRDLKEMCDEGSFRQDLYFRMSVLPIEVPPLRERKEDIKPLTEKFLPGFSESHPAGIEITDAAMQKLLDYPWPGNIRELQNALERASTFADGDRITPADLAFLEKAPASAVLPTDVTTMAGMTMAEIEKSAVEQTLEACRSNKAKAARMLGISEKSIYNKMKRLGISPAQPA